MSPVGGRILSSVHAGNLIPVTEMKNVQNAPQNSGGTAFRLFSDLTSHAQLKMFFHGQSRYPGWSVHMGKFSSSVPEISGPLHMSPVDRAGPVNEISVTELEIFPI